MEKTGIFYGSSSGDTEYVARQIQKELGGDKDVEVKNIVMADQEDLQEYDNLIFGTSTWRDASLQYDWEFYQDLLDKTDFSGKKVAFYGTGDQINYPDNFVDAMKILYDKVKKNNGEVVGAVSTDDYYFNKSKAVVDNKFVGLPIDESNEYQKTSGRVKKWCEELKKEFY